MHIKQAAVEEARNTTQVDGVDDGRRDVLYEDRRETVRRGGAGSCLVGVVVGWGS